MDGRYRLDLIGPFGLFTPDQRRIEISSRKSIALIALLATSPGGVRTRQWLRQMLWGDSSEAQGQASLRRELSNLAQQLDRYAAGELLVREMQRVALSVDRLSVDVFSLGIDDRVHEAQFRGDFLEGLDLRGCEEFEDWLRLERARIDAIETTPAALPGAAPPTASDIYGGRLPSARDALEDAPPALPPKPSVAILPFEQLGAQEQPGLGTALADELSIQICRFPQLFVVSSGSARLLKEQGLTPAEIAHRLGVQYLIDGTLLHVGDRLRLSVALVTGATGEQQWADRFDGDGPDLLRAQDEVAMQIAPRIWTHVDLAERDRGLRHAGGPLGDYELYWRANALFRSWEGESMSEAVALLDRLTARNPECPWATSLAGYCHSLTYMLRATPNPEVARRRAVQFCQTAMRTGPENAEALGYCAGTIINIGSDIAVADRLIGRALTTLPGFQPTLFWGGWVDIARGEPARARERFELALRINPATGARGETLCGVGFSYLVERNPEEAMRYFAASAKDRPHFPPGLVGSCAAAWHAGDRDTARQLMSALPLKTALGLAHTLRREADGAYVAEALTGAAESVPAHRGF